MSKKTGGRGPRTVALVGPYGSGKTTLLESMLAVTGAIQRKGDVTNKNSVGDSSPESRARQMSVEVNCAATEFLGEKFTFLDCPGSIEFLQETLNVLPGIDAAIVVCEPEHAKTQMLKPFLKRLSDAGVPHFLFVNKIDKANGALRDFLYLLQEASDKPLLLRQIPIWEQGAVAGFVDLALERAFVYRPNAASEVVNINDVRREKEARFQMLERLADYDEHLMEELLSDMEPPQDEVFGDLTREFSDCQVVPVLIGSAYGDNGVRRLLKALRHEVPDVKAAAKRVGVKANGPATVQIMKSYHSAHGGKLSLARVLAGSLKDGLVLHSRAGNETRLGGLFTLQGATAARVSAAGPGDTIALARLEGVSTGDMLSSDGPPTGKPQVEKLEPVYRLAIDAADRKDEVKLTAAIGKLHEEDPSLDFEQNAETHEMMLTGQGEIHLKVAIEKLESKYGLKVKSRAPKIPYKETIRRGTAERGRHKRQSGGHGQFGDVVLVIAPQARGSGFVFADQIKGGVVPKQWIPSVEKGVVDYLKCGPLGFPVVDVAVALTDGTYHSVDSSDAAFQQAARIAMSEGMPKCTPVLLEPVMAVQIHVPRDATARVNALVSSRRGQLMGFDARSGWKGWDTVQAQMPMAELSDLILELRSLTQGVGSFDAEFDHLAELTGKLAEAVVARKAA